MIEGVITIGGDIYNLDEPDGTLASDQQIDAVVSQVTRDQKIDDDIDDIHDDINKSLSLRNSSGGTTEYLTPPSFKIKRNISSSTQSKASTGSLSSIYGNDDWVDEIRTCLFKGEVN